MNGQSSVVPVRAHRIVRLRSLAFVAVLAGVGIVGATLAAGDTPAKRDVTPSADAFSTASKHFIALDDQQFIDLSNLACIEFKANNPPKVYTISGGADVLFEGIQWTPAVITNLKTAVSSSPHWIAAATLARGQPSDIAATDGECFVNLSATARVSLLPAKAGANAESAMLYGVYGVKLGQASSSESVARVKQWIQPSMTAGHR